MVVVADGVPSVWLWFAWAVVSNAMTMVIGPMSSALAMEPMAAKAGTASAILGLSQLGIGSVLAAAIDSRVGCTVTPMLVGGLVFGAAGAAVALGGIQRDIVGAMAERGIFGTALQLPATGYAFVYVVEIGLLLLTVLVMSRFIGAMRPVEAGRAGAVLKGPDRAGSIQPF